MPDVVIVGGGVIGCATAYFLARDGAKVTVLERGALAGEASGAAAGMLAALSDEGGDRGPAFQTLCLDSLALYEPLLHELDLTGVDVRYRRTGVLHLALNEVEAEELHRRYESQRSLAPENRWLASKELLKEEPGANPAAAGGLLCPREHYLDPQRLTLALAEAAKRHGARIVTNAPVHRFLRRGDSLQGVQTPDASHTGDAVVLAGGPWTAELARRLGAHVPVRPVRGQMLSLDGPAQPLRYVIWGSAAYLVPREDGQTFVGATVEEAGFRKRTTAPALRRLQRGAIGLTPSLAGASMRRSWAGLRPATPDALPVMGLLPGWRNVWVSTGHFRNGILLAPISGLLMAKSVMKGTPEASLAPFSATRFE